MKLIFSLVVNEQMKIFRKPSTMVLLALIIVGNLLVSIAMRYIFNGTGFTFWDQVNVSSYLLFAITILTIIIAGESIAGEYSSGTIKLLLIRPISRLKLLVAKYLAVVSVAVIFTMLHFGLATFFAGLFFYDSVFPLDSSFFARIGLNYLFGLIEMMIICSLAMMLSMLTKNSAIAVSLPILLLMSSKLVLEILSHYQIEQGKYYLFANSQLGQYFFTEPLFEGMTVSFSLTINSLYLLAFFALSALVFIKRDVS